MDYCCADIVALEREGDGGEQSQNLGSRVALLPGKFVQIRKVFVFVNYWLGNFGKCSDNMQSVCMNWKVSG